MQQTVNLYLNRVHWFKSNPPQRERRMKERPKGRKEKVRKAGGWKVRKGEKLRKGKGKVGTNRHFVRGKPLKGNREVTKGREAGVYGCGKRRAKERCRSFGVSERAKLGKMRGVALGRMERTMKSKMLMGPERKRKEREAIQKEYVRGTVRGRKMKRGLPVRGQRTSTNGKTARRLNGKRV